MNKILVLVLAAELDGRDESGRWFLIYLFVFLAYMCVGIWPVHMSVNHLCGWYRSRPEKGVRYPGAGVADSCEPLLCECWKLNQVLWKGSK